MSAPVLDCGHPPSPHESCTTGYGTRADGTRHCYACCADYDRARMVETGRAVLYLTKSGQTWTVTNWPGSLTFYVVATTTGRHNIARTRHDVWFWGPDNARWHAVQYGEDSQLAHCRRVKA